MNNGNETSLPFLPAQRASVVPEHGFGVLRINQRMTAMTKRVWIIEGWHGTTNFFSKEIPCAALNERQVKDVLKCLVAKHGLSEDEIVSAFARKSSLLFAPHLEIQTSGAKDPWSLTCGNNPFFTARVADSADENREENV